MGWLDAAFDSSLLIPGSAITAGVWLFYRLFLRSDKRERDAFLEVKEQRDTWRARAEQAEEDLAVCAHDLALLRIQSGQDPPL